MKASEVIKEVNRMISRIRVDRIGLVYGDESRDVTRIAVAWACSLELLKKLAENGYDMIIVHENVFHKAKGRESGPGKSGKAEVLSEHKRQVNLEKKRVIEEKGLVVYQLGAKWDLTEGHNNDALAEALHLKNVRKIPCGRIGEVEMTTLKEFAEFVKEKLDAKIVTTIGNPDKEIFTVATISGPGLIKSDVLGKAYESGADAIVAGKMTAEIERLVRNLDIAVIDAGHFETENQGMKALARNLSEKLSSGPKNQSDGGAARVDFISGDSK